MLNATTVKKALMNLSYEQQKRYDEYVDKWRRQLLSAEPTNKAEAEIGIRLAYAAAGKKSPEIIWCQSPLAVISEALERYPIKESYAMESKDIFSEVARDIWRKIVADDEKDWFWYQPMEWDNVCVEGISLRLPKLRFTSTSWDFLSNRKATTLKRRLFEDGFAGASMVTWAPWRQANREFTRRLPGANLPSWKNVHPLLACHLGGREESLAIVDFLVNEVGLVNSVTALAPLLIAKNTTMFVPYDDVCIVCEHPTTISLDERRNLHDETGPALVFGDGCAVYAIHGVPVEACVVENPELITVEDIDAESNAEVRSVKLLRYGIARYFQAGGATLIDDHPRFGKLWRKDFITTTEFGRTLTRPMFVLEVINSTAEPDGSFNVYIIPVRPTCTGNPALEEGSPMDSAYKAVWSTFPYIWSKGIPYDPEVET